MNTKTIAVNARLYEDEDDCLAAAEADYIDQHPEAAGWDIGARWADDQRETILLDVPA